MRLRTVPDEPDQVPRTRTCGSRPGRPAGGRAAYRSRTGEMVITRYTLCDLLDKLDQLLPPAGEEEP